MVKEIVCFWPESCTDTRSSGLPWWQPEGQRVSDHHKGQRAILPEVGALMGWAWGRERGSGSSSGWPSGSPELLTRTVGWTPCGQLLVASSTWPVGLSSPAGVDPARPTGSPSNSQRTDGEGTGKETRRNTGRVPRGIALKPNSCAQATQAHSEPQSVSTEKN